MKIYLNDLKSWVQKLKWLPISFLFLSLFSCFNQNNGLELPPEVPLLFEDPKAEFYEQNYFNIMRAFPFYVVKQEAFLYLTKPGDSYSLPKDYKVLSFGDILFPSSEKRCSKYFFYVKTIDDVYGWVHTESGISIDHTINEALRYFGEEYYLKSFKDGGTEISYSLINSGSNDGTGDAVPASYLKKTLQLKKGQTSNSDKIVLIKNIVPLLLENFQVDGWFYPPDYDLALSLSRYAVSIAQNRDTFFYTTSTYHWRYNEYVVSMNLLADSYHKLKYYQEAADIHNTLRARYFWQRSDNTKVGGLNSVVKLEKVYLDMIKQYENDSPEYRELRENIIDTILILGDNYNTMTIMDKKWHVTAAEWLLDILRTEVDGDDFYTFCNMIMARTTSEGYKDLVRIYKALELYDNGEKDKAMKIFSSIKPKNNFKMSLHINDWLSSKKIVPEYIIYQYKF